MEIYKKFFNNKGVGIIVPEGEQNSRMDQGCRNHEKNLSMQRIKKVRDGERDYRSEAWLLKNSTDYKTRKKLRKELKTTSITLVNSKNHSQKTLGITPRAKIASHNL